MKAQLQINNPDQIEFTLTIIQTLAEWKEFQAQLPDKWPSVSLSRYVNDMIIQASERFAPTTNQE